MIQIEARCYVAGTEIDGRAAIRCCFVNPLTTRNDVLALGADLVAAGRRLVAAQARPSGGSGPGGSA